MMATSGALCARCHLALFAGKMAQSDDWREIAITLTDLPAGVLSVIA